MLDRKMQLRQLTGEYLTFLNTAVNFKSCI